MSNEENQNDNDPHLNLFRFYSDGKKDYIENNLTRGVALALKHDFNFLLFFLQKLGLEVNQERISEMHIDLQEEMKTIEMEGISEVLAVSLTDHAEHLRQDDYNKAQPQKSEGKAITDLTIRYGETLIVLEVKRLNQNPLGQLKGQIQKLELGKEVALEYHSLLWMDVVDLLEDSKKLNESRHTPNLISIGFLEHLERSHLDLLGYATHYTLGELLKSKSDKIGTRLHYIASRIRPELRKEVKVKDHDIPSVHHEYMRLFAIWPDNRMVYVVAWPGFTKGQGGYLLNEDRWKFLDQHGTSFTEQGIEVKTNIKPAISYVFGSALFGKGGRSTYIPIETAKEHFNRGLWDKTGQWKRQDPEGQIWKRGSHGFEKLLTGDDSWKQNFYNYYDEASGEKKKVFITMRAVYELHIKLDKLVELDGPTAEKGAEKLKDFFEAVIKTVEDKIEASRHS